MATDENFLARWSKRKHEATAGSTSPAEAAVVPAPPAAVAAESPAPIAAHAGKPEPLPPVETLTPESDFAPFMAPGVDGGVRSQALKALFVDPHFNVMDMLDVYVDDYSQPDPLPEGWLEKLEQVSRLGDRAGRDREEAERRQALQAEQAEQAARRDDADTGIPESAGAQSSDANAVDGEPKGEGASVTDAKSHTASG